MTELMQSESVSSQVAVASSDIAATLLQNSHASVDWLVFGFAVFILTCFVGYFVVWKVTPALHTPLMAVTNAISGVVIVGAIIALGASKELSAISVISFIAIIIASINIFGGFLVTWRMLEMFKK